ncbi:Hsp70 family protein [Pedobacter metabolipauper]|uniref:Molecular chaperone DnaK/molecular chaperone HscC n=1 Tax=Pedobacter metabolipauper TaxID=425513 RepID=A0A4R6SY70_9SPHI|nr:Hsp70 family protein [Pedobacter metabolipauper]TDQ09435.1 molecular chaperone DnaK/molecular chaperone HscC [Pedobacter metabolipauper]
MVLGIDLGTSNTVSASLSRDGSPVLIPDAHHKDQLTTPSIALIEGKRAYAGGFAENLFQTLPDKQIISFFKRSFGTQDPVYFDDHKNAWFSETVASLILKKVKSDAELYLPDGFKRAVITVPAHYNDVQRKSVIEAAKLADLELSAIIEEPVAAALFYGSFNKKIDEEIILIYDFGGGTFDLTLITKAGNQLNVIAKDGVNKLGGKEFDQIVHTTIRESYEKAFKCPFPTDKLVTNRIQKIAENIKIELNDTEIPRDLRKWIMVGRDAFEATFHYDTYAAEANQLIAKTETAVNRCLRSLGMQLKDINKIVLIGGTSSSKLVYNYWKQKMVPGQDLIYHQPLSSVAKGAALYAGSFGEGSNAEITPIDLRGVSTYNIGLILSNENSPAKPQIDLLVHRNTPLPITSKKVYKISPHQREFVSFELCQFWDPKEDVHQLGTIKAGPFSLMADFYMEIAIENRLNGTIGIKLKNADNGRDIKFEFIRKESNHTYDFKQQKALVDGVYLNNNI